MNLLRRTRPRWLWVVLLIVLFAHAAAAQVQAPALLLPDARYKADVLLIVAHPDDDVVIGGYLARVSLDQRKRIAVIYCTDGDGGGNSVGNESGAALGLVREMEARRALGFLGIENVWFLKGHDTPGQNVLRSLDRWNHGLALDEVMQLVRITRPEVILTWLPDPVVGENHDDHQASSVLATEAFDMAGDPTWFPEQVSPPHDRTGMENLTEGLLPWQAKKLYFFTDAFEDFGPYWHEAANLSPYRRNFLAGNGPSYENKDISPARHESYAQLNAEQQVFYQTQEGDIGDQAVKNHDFSGFAYPMRLILGKSLVGGSATGDVFEGVSSSPAPFVRVRGYEPATKTGLSLEIGDPWRFYSLFWKAHDLDRMGALIPVPEMDASGSELLNVPLLACNQTGDAAEIAITSSLPAEWTDHTPYMRYPVRAGECYPIQARIGVSAADKAHWSEITWTASTGSQRAGSVKVRVFVGRSGGLPQ